MVQGVIMFITTVSDKLRLGDRADAMTEGKIKPRNLIEADHMLDLQLKMKIHK